MTDRKATVLDMTKGNAVRMVLTFAVPLFIGNTFRQIYSMADTMAAVYLMNTRKAPAG